MQDIVISSVPYIEPTAPTAAPALLKGYLITQGFEVTAYDWNLEFKRYINDPDLYGELIAYWTGTNRSAMRESTRQQYHTALEHFAKKFASINTRWLGFGVFSRHSQQCLQDLLKHLRKHDLGETRIVVGGHGLDVLFLDSVEHMIDAYIQGEGELALCEVLKENFDYPGVNSAGVQIEDLDQLGFADYSDYELKTGYDSWYDVPMIQITGSRGCVRDCTFCDVGNIWKKYRYRSGQSLAQEIITNHESTGLQHFYFTDSLINGNVRQLMEMMRILTDYKQRTGSKLTWGGQWISRPQRGLPKDYYKLIKSSGGFNLTLGVETGSDAVRTHMKKNFTNEDLDAEMQQLSNYGISCGFFMIVGYPTETEEDFKDTLRMFKRYVKYVADGTIIGVAIGSGYVPLEGTPLVNAGKDVRYIDSSTNLKWLSTTTNSNYIENIRRRLIAQTVLNNLKWPANNIEYELRAVIQNSNLLFDEQDKKLMNDLLLYKDVNVDPEFLAEKDPHAYNVEIVLTGTEGKDYPVVDININGTIHANICIQGTQTLSFRVDQPRKKNLIKISLLNKTDEDVTFVDGKFIKDKTVKLEKFVIHGSTFNQQFLVLNGKVKTKETGWQKYRDGLYCQQDTYVFYFENPVYEYFIRKNKYYYDTKNQVAKNMLDKVTHLFHDFVN
jgi:radical SAM superfamily enzyme YgiQ (UPF0313 family)